MWAQQPALLYAAEPELYGPACQSEFAFAED
jgi:hypothetical protein